MKNSPFEVADSKKVRVIIDTDAACEADDQYAIAHALMSTKVEVAGIMAEHFGHMAGSMQASYEEISRICALMEIEGVCVLEGAEQAMSDPAVPVISAAGRFLAEQAGKEDDRPLFVLCQGALTNVAAAIMTDPDIQDNLQIIMVGGTNYPHGGFEFNTMNDPLAFNIVMNSRASVWVIPEEVYATMQAGLMELRQKVEPCGSVGHYLYEHTLDVIKRMTETVPAADQMSAFEQALAFPNGESWSLGDSVGIGLLLMHHAGTWETVPAPQVLPDGSYSILSPERKVRWYTGINQRCILEDFFAKLQYYFA